MPRAGVSAPGREGPQSSTPVVGKTARQVPKSLLSLSTSSFLADSLTSLVYGEQSEKTSPSDISLEMEHRDKVGPGGLVRGGRGWARWPWTGGLGSRRTRRLAGRGHSTRSGSLTSDKRLNLAKPVSPSLFPQRKHRDLTPAAS